MQYRVASILKLNGFGASVIQRLVKTSVKKNLYWEIKERVIEESFNGIRSVKHPQKVRVYGLDSNREVRSRLIEILYDRVRYHKDKFVAPILHAEMQSMEIKKNGKVEHSSNSHDDQVFSYLMALYVWYDGKNLAENFHIMRNTIKTDENTDIEELKIEDSLESNTKVEVDNLYMDPESEIGQDLQWVITNSKLITSNDLKDKQHFEISRMRDSILASNESARISYCKENGLDPSLYSNNANVTFVDLPDTVFMDTDFDPEEDENNYSVLQGNLSSYWDQL